MIAHAAVHTCQLFNVVCSQSHGTFAVKQTDVFLRSVNYVILSKITTLDYK